MLVTLVQLFIDIDSGGMNSYFMRRPPHAKVGWVGILLTPSL